MWGPVVAVLEEWGLPRDKRSGEQWSAWALVLYQRVIAESCLTLRPYKLQHARFRNWLSLLSILLCLCDVNDIPGLSESLSMSDL